MKSKNLVIAAFSFALAIGSAFTYASLPGVTAWVKVKYTGEATFTCRSTSPLQCSNLAADTHACKIVVADINQETNAYSNSNCNVFLRGIDNVSNGTFNPVQTIIEAPSILMNCRKSSKTQDSLSTNRLFFLLD